MPPGSRPGCCPRLCGRSRLSSGQALPPIRTRLGSRLSAIVRIVYVHARGRCWRRTNQAEPERVMPGWCSLLERLLVHRARKSTPDVTCRWRFLVRKHTSRHQISQCADRGMHIAARTSVVSAARSAGGARRMAYLTRHVGSARLRTSGSGRTISIACSAEQPGSIRRRHLGDVHLRFNPHLLVVKTAIVSTDCLAERTANGRSMFSEGPVSSDRAACLPRHLPRRAMSHCPHELFDLRIDLMTRPLLL